MKLVRQHSQYNLSRPCAFIQVPHYHREWVGRAPSKAYLSSEVYTIKSEDVATELPAVYAISPLSLISRLANRVTRFEQLRIRALLHLVHPTRWMSSRPVLLHSPPEGMSGVGSPWVR